MPATPTVSRCAQSTSVGPPPRPSATALARPGATGSSQARTPRAESQSRATPATASSPVPDSGSSAGLTEGVQTSAPIASASVSGSRGGRISLPPGRPAVYDAPGVTAVPRASWQDPPDEPGGAAASRLPPGGGGPQRGGERPSRGGPDAGGRLAAGPRGPARLQPPRARARDPPPR